MFLLIFGARRKQAHTRITINNVILQNDRLVLSPIKTFKIQLTEILWNLFIVKQV